MEQAATLPHNVYNFSDRNLEIESYLATRNIIGHHIRRTFHHWIFLFEANFKFTQYVKKQKPRNICDLRWRVNRFAENIDEEASRKMVRLNRKRAVLCIDSVGGHFEELL